MHLSRRSTFAISIVGLLWWTALEGRAATNPKVAVTTVTVGGNRPIVTIDGKKYIFYSSVDGINQTYFFTLTAAMIPATTTGERFEWTVIEGNATLQKAPNSPSGTSITTEHNEPSVSVRFTGEAASLPLIAVEVVRVPRQSASTARLPKDTIRIQPIEFKPVNVDRGFDPFIYSDVDQGSGKDEGKTPREFWTSVSRKSGGTFFRNENINIVFPSDIVAKACRVLVRNASSAPISISPQLPQTRVTRLTIEGKGAEQIHAADAFIEIRDKVQQNLLHTLMVKVLPERKISFRVWFLKDPQQVNGTQDERTQVPQTARGYFTNLQQKLKDAFHQACIDFEQTHPPEEIEIDYDGIAGANSDGLLQINSGSNTLDHPEYTKILDATVFSARLNFVIARAGHYPGVSGLGGVGRRGVNKVLIFTEPYNLSNKYSHLPWVCAHEAGHALGLSTRNVRAYPIRGLKVGRIE